MRVERDSLGEVRISDSHYYGVQTHRAKRNFCITGIPIGAVGALVEALGHLKYVAARANADLGVLGSEKADVIMKAADRVSKLEFRDDFVVDLLQGGAGTSTNMNANEVVANVGLEQMGRKKGEYRYLHPIDDVNRSQSTNDVYPTALRLAIRKLLLPICREVQRTIEVCRELAERHKSDGKMARTQLQDAVPMTSGREFAAFASRLEKTLRFLQNARSGCRTINLGGTAIGMGTNVPEGYPKAVIGALNERLGDTFCLAKDTVEATSSTFELLVVADGLKYLALDLDKISSDLRLLNSGPRAGLGDISLAPCQVGSSIMPGKINPVIPEVCNQVAYSVISNGHLAEYVAHAAQLQLNAMEPALFGSIWVSIRTLRGALKLLRTRALETLTVCKEKNRKDVAQSLGIGTYFTPFLSYDLLSKRVRQAYREDKTIPEVLLENWDMSEQDIDKVLRKLTYGKE